MSLAIAIAVSESLQAHKAHSLLKEQKPSKSGSQVAELFEGMRNKGVFWGAAGGMVVGVGVLTAAICLTVQVAPAPLDTVYTLYVVGGLFTAGSFALLVVQVRVHRRQAHYQGLPEKPRVREVLGPEVQEIKRVEIEGPPREMRVGPIREKRVEIPGPPREVNNYIRIQGPPREVIRRIEVPGPGRTLRDGPCPKGFVKASTLTQLAAG